MHSPKPAQRHCPRLLLVDDDPLIADTLAYLLGTDYDITIAGSRTEGVAAVRDMASPPELALVDLGLPPTPHRPDEGFALISDLLAHAPDLKIVVLSGQSQDQHARHARALGAVDFVAKPADPEHLQHLLKDALRMRSAELSARRDVVEWDLIGASPALEKVRAQARQFANSPFPVLIEGESGSGKEIVATRLLHGLTDRRNKPLLAINCAAISPALLEATLFGYAKGAFTGAIVARAGYFEDASDGTLFLDEIGELPLELQPKLLRVLENGEFQRVGETVTRFSRARVIAATNRDLRQEVREGRFRSDLYYRLSVFSVSIPPLRETGDDRLLLLDHFRAIYARESGCSPFTLAPDAEALWRQYTFPGNVRELRNIIIRLTAKFPGATLHADKLAEEFDPLVEGSAAATLPNASLPEPSIDAAMARLGSRHSFSLDAFVSDWERAFVDAAQRLARGNLSQAARLLGVNRTTLYNRIEVLERQRPRD